MLLAHHCACLWDQADLSPSLNAHDLLCSVTDILVPHSSPSFWSVWEQFADKANQSCVWSSIILSYGPSLPDWLEISIVPANGDFVWQLISLAACLNSVFRSATATSYVQKVSVFKVCNCRVVQLLLDFHIACSSLVMQIHPQSWCFSFLLSSHFVTGWLSCSVLHKATS